MTIIINKNKTMAIAGFAILGIFLLPSAFGIKIDTTLDAPFDLKIEEAAIIDSTYQITFLNVTEDSRCPADAFCVWQGTVSVQVNVTKDGQSRGSHILPISESDGVAPETLDGHFIKLIQVEPYPLSSKPTLFSDYVATFVVSKAKDVTIASPLDQFKTGVPINEIQCKENLVVVIKSSNYNPACVTQSTAEKLISRGWAIDTSSIDTFEECAAVGNPVMESYPRQCKTSDGKHFVEETDSKIMSPESLCEKYGGNWLQEFNECETISAEQCSIMDGNFKECESACRHMPDAEVCVALCVPVCVIP